MSSTRGSLPSLYCRSYSDTSWASRALTGRIQRPARVSCHSLPAVSGEEQGVRASGAEGSQKAQLRHADVLRLVHHAELERRALQLRELALQATDQARFGQEPVLVESGGHLGEDRPEELPLPFGQASPPTEPRLVPILFQARKLPGVDHAAPLGPQEAQAEPECGPSGKTATGSTTSAKPSCSATTCERC